MLLGDRCRLVVLLGPLVRATVRSARCLLPANYIASPFPGLLAVVAAFKVAVEQATYERKGRLIFVAPPMVPRYGASRQKPGSNVEGVLPSG